MERQTVVLVVDDAADMRNMVVEALRGRFCMEGVANAEQALEVIGSRRIDILVTDVMLGEGMNGFELCKAVKGNIETSHIRVILTTVLSENNYRERGYKAGADAYVVKPFDPRELLARIRTVLRRASDKGQAAAQSDIRRFAGWTLNVRSRELSQGDERIALSDAMYRLLLVFLDEPFAVLSREYLLRQTQGRDADVFDRSVDIQVSRLRGVLKDTGTSKIIKTVRGGGYMLSVDVEHDA